MSEYQVVSLCDLTGTMARPWAEAGYDCLCIDIQHSIRADRVERVGSGSITYRWADARALAADDFGRPIFAAAFPPCTHLAVSGARDFATKGVRLLIDALEVVESCRVTLAQLGCPWMLENPVGRLSTLWRKPDHTFDPCDFGGYVNGGDAYTKKTCLWVGNGFVMPPAQRVEPIRGSAMHLLPPSPDRANQRSATPEGFARAVFQANAPHLRLTISA